ncbi:hypothetical protein G7Z99_17605 [Pseudomonas entomophila]|nr:hypothetical protein [Pseudomonas entomophila]
MWPSITPPTPDELGDDDSFRRSMFKAVHAGDWTIESDVVLEESRRLFDAEADRRKGADAKAGIYLAAITALIPVLASLVPNIWNDMPGKLIGWLGLIVFGLAVSYLLRAGAWAFKTLQIGGFNQVGPSDLAACWKEASPKAALAKELSNAVLKNFPKVNRKITGIKMTHEFLLRAFLAFTALLVLQVIWPVGGWVAAELSKLMSSPKAAPLIMCFS